MQPSFDPQLSAKCHNKILEYAWIGAGRDLSSLSSETWWENSSPVSFDLASRLSPKLIQFLRLAKSVPFSHPDFHFFYFLRGLQESRDLLRFSILDTWGDRFVWLYPATCSTDEDEVGILFDQETELAAFFPTWEDVSYAEKPWPWRPLQHILQAYLEMIDEGKVTTSSELENTLPEQFYPWKIHHYTRRDLEKAVAAFTRLLDAIESRLPPTTSNEEIRLPYSDLMIDDSMPTEHSFIRSFLLAVPPRRIKFHYIAPGIRIQPQAEFVSQPFTKPHDDFQMLSELEKPALLFRADGTNYSPWTRPWFLDGVTRVIPAGLYIEATLYYLPNSFGNESRLLLPFGIGAKQYARSSNGVPLSHFSSTSAPDVSCELYQVYQFSGFLPTTVRCVQLHKVLLNWVDRVESGDWDVNEDGVAGGIEKFKEADTLEHWQKYQVPQSW
ncbi:hypothetical protein N7457_005143 [Penicillium paradoxum]|uniref:uncharacterized protein n=1 Tax=Penicillium paradoxum TaxID=176176 RepID=UPI0025481C88|nr:uncharacterized protein N7457_005143 [Penicillium paradoxum]KAJ5779983.1 hypothetical protein N7457_005143 [Penicillium paradoxum]